MTALRAPTLHRRLIYVLPGLSTSQHIIDLFPLKLHLLLEGLIYNEDVGAGFAEETKIACSFLCKQ